MSAAPGASSQDRGPQCLPDAQLAAWAADPKPLPLLLPHLRRCPRCRARARQLREEASFARHVASALEPHDPAALHDPAAPPHLPPPEIPGYTIVGELARGGQGIVYRAVQHETNRAVAVKTILRGQSASSREIARFEREVEIAASLSHPLIVPVFEARVLPDGRHVLAMQLIDGDPLSTWAAHAPAGLAGARARVALIRDAARAVQYAHTQGVIHRDLKPGNIIVDPLGAPHILDFGLARRGHPSFADEPSPPVELAESSARLWALTMFGAFQGTPAYAAPEQFEDREPVDVRADVYALGVILHELLTGLAPFADSSGLESVVQSKRSRPLPPAGPAAESRGLRGVNADLDAVIAKACARRRDDRYPSAAALADDLDAFLAARAVSARTDLPYRLRKLVRRRLLPLSIAAAAFATLGAFLLQAAAHNRALRSEKSALRQLAVVGAAALARSDDRLGAERLLWDQLRDAPPGDDLWRRARLGPESERPFLWALLELYGARPCVAARSSLQNADLIHLHDGALSLLDPDGAFLEFRASDLTPLAPPRLLSPRPRGAFAVPPDLSRTVYLSLTDGRYRCLDLQSGAELGSLPDDELSSAVLSQIAPDGASVLFTAKDGGTRLHRLPDLAELLRFPPAQSRSARLFFTPDGRALLALDALAGDFISFSLPDGRPISSPFRWRKDYLTLIGNDPGVLRLEFAPSGRAVAVCSERGLLILDDSGDLRCSAAAVTVGQNLAARWSPSERWLVTWSNGDSVPKLLDARSLAPVAAFHGHDGRLRGVAFSPDEHALLTIDTAGALRRWPLPGADWITRLGPLVLGDHRAANHAAFAPDGAIWAARGDGRVLALPPSPSPTSAPARDIFTSMPNARGVDFLPAFEQLPPRVILSGDGPSIQIHPRDADGPVQTLPLPASLQVFSLAVSPDARLFAAGAGDAVIRVWDARSLQPVAERRFGPDRIPSLRWTPDSAHLVAAVGGGDVRILDARTLADAPPAPAASSRIIRSVAVSPPDPNRPDRFTILTLGDDRVVRVWAAPAMALLGQSARAENDLFCSDFHPSGLFAAVGDRGGAVHIIDARDGRTLARFRAKAPTMTVAWAPDGRSLLVGGGEGCLDLWDFQALADAIAANRPFWLPTPPHPR